jgi:diaminopimelate decarboxylase
VLTRVGLGGGRAPGDWLLVLPEIATQIEQAPDYACATLRFPRPLVVLTPGLAMMEQSAA